MNEAQRTIDDFGEQWTHFRSNEGYYGSLELFDDLIAPYLRRDDFNGASVADIGSGTGRIVRMLAAAGASRIVAVEPSAAMGPLRENTRDLADRVDYVQATGDRLAPAQELDLVVSFGVLHHIPDPDPVVRAALAALRPGGRMLVWLYGYEGNELYLALARSLRLLTRRLPHAWLSALSRGLVLPVDVYIAACRHLRLPMRDYMVRHLGALGRDARILTIYDQLNPQYARYYRRDEAIALLSRAGFVDVRAHHRHGYSWTVIGTRPPGQ
jgi:SAM-dependent methyltransferase